MCVAIYKPANEAKPTYETLLACAKANKDGQGFCTSTGKTFHSMSFFKFMSELSKIDDSEAIIMHFRWATHGSICRRNCHPFYDKEHDLFFAHNGILPIEATNDRTDSETFFKDMFIPMLDKYGWDSKVFWDWVNVERGSSRFIFMQGEEVTRLGHWDNVDGCWYSNLNWTYYLNEPKYDRYFRTFR